MFSSRELLSLGIWKPANSLTFDKAKGYEIEPQFKNDTLFKIILP